MGTKKLLLLSLFAFANNSYAGIFSDFNLSISMTSDSGSKDVSQGELVAYKCPAKISSHIANFRTQTQTDQDAFEQQINNECINLETFTVKDAFASSETSPSHYTLCKKNESSSCSSSGNNFSSSKILTPTLLDFYRLQTKNIPTGSAHLVLVFKKNQFSLSNLSRKLVPIAAVSANPLALTTGETRLKMTRLDRDSEEFILLDTKLSYIPVEDFARPFNPPEILFDYDKSLIARKILNSKKESLAVMDYFAVTVLFYSTFDIKDQSISENTFWTQLREATDKAQKGDRTQLIDLINSRSMDDISDLMKKTFNSEVGFEAGIASYSKSIQTLSPILQKKLETALSIGHDENMGPTESEGASNGLTSADNRSLKRLDRRMNAQNAANAANASIELGKFLINNFDLLNR